MTKNILLILLCSITIYVRIRNVRELRKGPWFAELRRRFNFAVRTMHFQVPSESAAVFSNI